MCSSGDCIPLGLYPLSVDVLPGSLLPLPASLHARATSTTLAESDSHTVFTGWEWHGDALQRLAAACYAWHAVQATLSFLCRMQASQCLRRC